MVGKLQSVRCIDNWHVQSMQCVLQHRHLCLLNSGSQHCSMWPAARACGVCLQSLNRAVC